MDDIAVQSAVKIIDRGIDLASREKLRGMVKTLFIIDGRLSRISVAKMETALKKFDNGDEQYNRNEIRQAEELLKNQMGLDLKGAVSRKVTDLMTRMSTSSLHQINDNGLFNELVDLGDIAVAPLIDVAAGKDFQVHFRMIAARALGHIKEPEARMPLETMLKENDDSIRAAAAHALGLIGQKGSVPALVALINDSSELTRLAALNSLCQIGDEKALDPLAAILKNENRESSDYLLAAHALVKCGLMKALPFLEPALADAKCDLRPAAVISLAELYQLAGKPEKILMIFKKHLQEENDEPVMVLTRKLIEEISK
jgi:HEAT repeat protein